MKNISSQDTYDHLQRQDCILVDVREVAEYKEESIPGSILLPLSHFSLQDYQDLDVGKKTLIIHCRSGVRSQQVCHALLEAHFSSTVFNLKGGILAWKQEGFPTHIPIGLQKA